MILSGKSSQCFSLMTIGTFSFWFLFVEEMEHFGGIFTNNGLWMGGKVFLSSILVTRTVNQALILLKTNDYY